jgi:hypothetical protein
MDNTLKMKKLTTILVLTIFAAAGMLSSCHMKAKKALAYHDKVLFSTQTVVDSFLDYGDAIRTYNKQTAMEGHTAYVQLVEKTRKAIEPMEDFDGNKSLRNSCMNMLSFYKVNLAERMEPFLNTVKGPEFTDAEVVTADSLLDVITNTEMPYWEELDKAEKQFYRQFNLQVLQAE